MTAQVQSWGAEAHNLGVARDNRDDLMAKLREALALQPDLLIISAGVSVGDYDIVKEVLMSIGTISMWRVRVKPGKPLAFGRIGERGVPFLGLPGNPVLQHGEYGAVWATRSDEDARQESSATAYHNRASL